MSRRFVPISEVLNIDCCNDLEAIENDIAESFDNVLTIINCYECKYFQEHNKSKIISSVGTCYKTKALKSSDGYCDEGEIDN